MKKTILFLTLFLLIHIYPLICQENSAKKFNEEDFLKLALESNRELSIQKLEQKKSKLKWRIAWSKWLPQIGFSADLAYLSHPLDPIVIKAQSIPVSIPTADGLRTLYLPAEEMTVLDDFQGMNPFEYEIKASVDQLIFSSGKVFNSLRARKEGRKAEDIQLEKKWLKINLGIKSSLRALFLLKNISQLLENQKQIAQRLALIAKDSYDKGFMLKVDYLEIKVKVQEILLAEMESKEEISDLLREMAKTCALEEIKLEQINFPDFDAEQLYQNLPQESRLMQKILQNNKDLQLLAIDCQAADYQLKISKGSFYFMPDIGLHIDFGLSGPIFQENWQNKSRFNALFALGLRANFFDGLKQFNEYQIKLVELQQKKLAREQGIKEIKKVVRKIINQLRLSKERAIYYQLSAENKKAIEEQKKAEWKSGMGQETDMLKAELEYYSQEILGLQEQIHFIQLYYQLQGLSGFSE